MKINRLLAALALVLSIGATASAQEREPSSLAPGRRIYITRAAPRDDMADELTDALNKWGRWPVVATPENADLFATVTASGNNQKGSVAVTIRRVLDGPTLWQEQDTGRRWHGVSGFIRALNVIIERLREASNKWPQT